QAEDGIRGPLVTGVQTCALPISDQHRAVRDRLAELSGAARKAADEAIAVAPDDPASLRAKIDALRISGDREGARAMVAKIASSEIGRASCRERVQVAGGHVDGQR